MVDAEEKRETGGSLMFAGLAVWVAGLLVLFYFPSAAKFGHKAAFEAILAVLGALGAVLMIRGWCLRRE